MKKEEENVDGSDGAENIADSKHKSQCFTEGVTNLRVFVEAEAIGGGWKTFEPKIAIRVLSRERVWRVRALVLAPPAQAIISGVMRRL